MYSGKLDRKIRIERDEGATQDSLGAQVESWDKLRDCWANVVPVNGAEVFRSGKDTASQAARFFVRYFSGLSEKDRISFEGKTWDIIYFREVGRREGLEIVAQVHK